MIFSWALGLWKRGYGISLQIDALAADGTGQAGVRFTATVLLLFPGEGTGAFMKQQLEKGMERLSSFLHLVSREPGKWIVALGMSEISRKDSDILIQHHHNMLINAPLLEDLCEYYQQNLERG